MITARDERRPRWRAERSGVEVVETDAGLSEAVHRRHRDGSAKGTGRAEASVIGQNEKDIRGVLRGRDLFGKVRSRVFGGAADLAFEGRVWSRQHFLGECRNSEPGGATFSMWWSVPL